MMGFMVAIATKNKTKDELILIGTDINAENNETDGNSEATIINNVDIFFDTIDNNVKQKSGGMLARVTIKGEILPEAKADIVKKLRKISEWARDRSVETTYRDLCVGVKAAHDRFQVVYVVKNVFVVDYREVYVGDGDHGSSGQDRFELYLTQRENNLDNISVLTDWPKDWEWARKD